jgi:hypothetical protein
MFRLKDPCACNLVFMTSRGQVTIPEATPAAAPQKLLTVLLGSLAQYIENFEAGRRIAESLGPIPRGRGVDDSSSRRDCDEGGLVDIVRWEGSSLVLALEWNCYCPRLVFRSARQSPQHWINEGLAIEELH